jgi:hypothetical protein
MTSSSEDSGYLPGDPRYGLSGEPLRRYYREKPAQWMIIAWDRASQAHARAANIAALELPDRAAAEHFWNNEPFAANGGYQEDSRIYRWEFGD